MCFIHSKLADHPNDAFFLSRSLGDRQNLEVCPRGKRGVQIIVVVQVWPQVTISLLNKVGDAINESYIHCSFIIITYIQKKERQVVFCANPQTKKEP